MPYALDEEKVVTMRKRYIRNSILIVLICFVVTMAIILIPPAFSEENRVLRKIYGKYECSETLYHLQAAVFPPNPNANEQKITFIIEKNRIYTNTEYLNITSPPYKVVKITDEMLNNGVYSQGIALQTGIMSYSVRQNLKGDSYAIFIDEPAPADTIPPKWDKCVLYYIDEKLYVASGFGVGRLGKIS